MDKIKSVEPARGKGKWVQCHKRGEIDLKHLVLKTFITTILLKTDSKGIQISEEILGRVNAAWADEDLLRIRKHSQIFLFDSTQS